MERYVQRLAPVENYECKLPVRAGIAAGLAGAIAIIAVITLLLLASGSDLFVAALPIIVGTLIHLTIGAVLGGVFARIMPRMHRNMYIIAGVMYGVAAWLVSTFLILPVVAPLMVGAEPNIYVLFLAHIVYGLVLGMAGGSYGLWWHVTAWDCAPGTYVRRRAS
jgi:hypothetical protein